MTSIQSYQGVNIPIQELFCFKCGTQLVRHPQRSCLICIVDGHEQEISYKMTQAHSLTKLNVEAIRKRRDLQSFEANSYSQAVEDVKDGALDMCIADQETCERCGTKGLQYFSRQMRSADEGQTVFFKCPKCKYVRVLQS
eukprot:TRINITY_DN5557_c2_g1_i1.p4 TRINITY_DN5557_c2_g1~~TRINITY_DN5557_c2_g1_i1.p4  ORF type:complete len:140 (+),score=1.66 TRINITY_DN5557_c2_g1_i1:166-585(+)